jgi:hypothetical protein
MAKIDSTIIQQLQSIMTSGVSDKLQKCKDAFREVMPENLPADTIFDEAAEKFADEELAEICGEIALTVHAGCTRDDFHNWNYDHLEFIIDLSNRHNFDIPKNFLNGLPEQLIILVDSDHVKKPRCDT